MRIDLTPPRGSRYDTLSGFEHETCPRCGGSVGQTTNEWRERYCRHCIQFGMVQESTRLYVSERSIPPTEHVLAIDYRLTADQEKASAFLVEMVRSRREALLHAVCGAGKTEILYALFLDALRRGERVCLTIPRRDIVVELAGRIAKAFPKTIVKALHQDAKDDEGAHLIVSTVHQLIRFKNEFDLIVLDEADAFPYRGEPFLERLIQNARKGDAPIVRMSATIDRALAKHLKANHARIYRLPVRYHGHPLDVPEAVWMTSSGPETASPEFLDAMIGQKQKGRKTIVFVPRIDQTIVLAKALCAMQIRAEAVSSRSVHRNAAIEDFRFGKLDCLVATSILERGVTFSDIDVFVYDAECEQFDAETLVQMAGRTGRSALFPSGSVRFYATARTKAIADAIKAVEQANRDAGFQRGRHP
jgi:competence protein ComFA